MVVVMDKMIIPHEGCLAPADRQGGPALCRLGEGGNLVKTEAWGKIQMKMDNYG